MIGYLIKLLGGFAQRFELQWGAYYVGDFTFSAARGSL
jgi:hypothetical protein